ncbi:MAG: hypothetical protein AAFX00_02470 [Pseudomonadota bacterium]
MDREERVLAYMQGRLDDGDREAFEADMSRDPELAAEVEVLRSVRSEFANEVAAEDVTDGWDRLSAELDRPQAANLSRAPRLAIWQVAAVVAFCLVAWEGLIAPQISGLRPGPFETVTEAVDGPTLQVVFAEDAPMGEVAYFLRTHNGTIVDGPGAQGIYRIVFTDNPDLAHTQEAMAQRSDLFELVLND